MAGQLAPKGGDIEDKQGFKRPARLRRGERGVKDGTERSHRLDLAQFCESREHLAGDGRAVAPGMASEHRRDELTGAAAIVAHTAGETIALERGVDSASVVGIEMTARRARWLVEGEARATIEGERHAAEANAARAVAAQGCVVGHGDLDRGCGRPTTGFAGPPPEFHGGGYAGAEASDGGWKNKNAVPCGTAFCISNSSEIRCSWQTWQRPTLPSLET